MAFLGRDFFERGVVEVARDLVGVELVWRGCSGVIVETEAYAAAGDAACHTMSRPSARAFVRERPPGAAYVYLNYGMYWLFNLLVKGGGQDGLVLVRALEPRAGLPLMRERRGRELPRELCSGPGKLGKALGLDGGDHGSPMAGRGRPAGSGLRATDWRGEVVADTRIGIHQAVELPWRFLAADNPFVSVPIVRNRREDRNTKGERRSG